MYYYAKSDPAESVEEHTSRLLELLAKLKVIYPKLLSENQERILSKAAQLHDMGKLSDGFQCKIRRAIYKKYGTFQLRADITDYCPLGRTSCKECRKSFPEQPHNYLSPAFVNKQLLLSRGWAAADIKLLCAVIFYHHDRTEPDFAKITAIIKDMQSIICEQTGIAAARIGYEKNVLSYRGNNGIGKGQPVNNAEYIFVHGMLNRLDYGASAHLTEIEVSPLDSFESTYAERTVESLNSYKARRDVQLYLNEHAATSLVVVAQTGSGKTEGALLWGQGRKMIYTLPLRTAINAMYKRIRNEINFKPTALLHSDAFSVLKQEAAESDIDSVEIDEAYAKAKQFTAPLTICTIDQIFKFVFRSSGSECQLATLSYSYVVIDEIQAYDNQLTACIIKGLELIKMMGGHFLIMTATLPKMLLRKELLGRVFGADYPLRYFYTDKNHRHKLALIKSADWKKHYDEILSAGEDKKVLVIANTVKAAQQIYEQLSLRSENVWLLHSRFLRADRARLEAEILDFAPNGSENDRRGVWVATQVVNASLDIDFDMLYTELCSIDELCQRMGRAYRNRNYEGEQPNIIVLDTKNGRGTVIDNDIYDFSLAAVSCCDGEILWEQSENDAKRKMMDMVYDEKLNPDILESAYYRGMLNRLAELDAIIPHELTREDVEANFRNIQSITAIPSPIYDKLLEDKTIDRWAKEYAAAKNNGSTRQQLREEIFEYTLSVPWRNYSNDRESVQHKDIIYERSNIFVLYGTYDERRGFEQLKHQTYNSKTGHNII